MFEYEASQLTIYVHDYGSGYHWVTNTPHPTLEAYLEWRQNSPYLTPLTEEEISQLVVFPDAYDCQKQIDPKAIAICRRVN